MSLFRSVCLALFLYVCLSFCVPVCCYVFMYACIPVVSYVFRYVLPFSYVGMPVCSVFLIYFVLSFVMSLFL